MDPFDLALILAYIFLIEAWYYPKLVVMKWRYATTTKTPVKFSKAENKLPAQILFLKRLHRREHRKEAMHLFYLLMTSYNFCLYGMVYEFPPEVQLAVCAITVMLNIEIAMRLMFPKPQKVLRDESNE